MTLDDVMEFEIISVVWQEKACGVDSALDNSTHTKTM